MFELKVSFQPPLKLVGDVFKRANLEKVLASIVEEFSFGIERYSKQVTPVRTGRLRASIGVSWMGRLRSFVAPHTNYAYWVHEGTRRMRARPFMKWGTEFAVRRLTKGDVAWRLSNDLRRQLTRLR